MMSEHDKSPFPEGDGDEESDDAPPGQDGDDVGRESADGGGRSRVRKAPNAFRTISEVADDLHIPQHVLRFWETKFPRVKPMKRGGGRRYYRPDDIALLRQISDLLYTQGYTIKGVQRLLRDGGGRLADDIPPPSDEERAQPGDEEDARSGGETGETGNPPDETPSREAMARERGTPSEPDRETAVPHAAPTSAQFRALPRRRADAQAERLRAVLVETLATLRALRLLLP